MNYNVNTLSGGLIWPPWKGCLTLDGLCPIGWETILTWREDLTYSRGHKEYVIPGH